MPPPQGQTQGKARPRAGAHPADHDYEPSPHSYSRGSPPVPGSPLTYSPQARSGRGCLALRLAAAPASRPALGRRRRSLGRRLHAAVRRAPPAAPTALPPLQVPMEPISKGDEYGRGGSVYGQSEFAG